MTRHAYEQVGAYLRSAAGVRRVGLARKLNRRAGSEPTRTATDPASAGRFPWKRYYRGWLPFMRSILAADVPLIWGRFRDENKPFFENTLRVYKGIEELIEGTIVVTPIPDTVICTLSAICLEDFNEVVGATALGLGFGAAKLLRCFYERVVTLRYLSLNPSEAETWMEYSHVNWKKLVKEDSNLDFAFMKTIEDNYNRVRPRFARGNTNKVLPNWTPKGVPDLASASSDILRSLYIRGFVAPTMHVHPTSLGMAFETKRSDEGGISLDLDTMGAEKGNALSLAHLLLIQVYETLNSYFKKGKAQDVDEFNRLLTATWPTVFQAEPAKP